MTDSDRLFRLPKAELHVHLDGSLRPETMLDLAAERDVTLPATDPQALWDYMVVSDARNLEDYLDRFRLTLALMQDEDAIERIAYELAEDHAKENVRYVEARFCPALNTDGGLEADAVLDASLRGLARAEVDHGIRTNVIVCGLRSLDPAVSIAMAELAAAYSDKGVCAFDLAGGEAGNPVRDHLEAFGIAEAAGLGITIHAGEGFGPESIRQALDDGHAHRIGHGTRLYEDPELMATVRDRAIPLEVCVTSNVQTRVAPSFGEHPVRQYLDEGLTLTLCTDNRLMSGVTLTEEYKSAQTHLGFDWDAAVRVARMGMESAFLAPETKAELLSDFDRVVSEL